ncbi:CpaD family pilus assembly protein [Pararhizobium mangrovi]|nr:CpaD family pilus assembly protein [Pararhizobium mangrovi]
MINSTRIGGGRRLRAAGLGVLALSVLQLAGCVGGPPAHSVIVGSVPTDYRTRHPIVVSSRAKTLDVPVAAGARSLTSGNADIVRGFADDFEKDEAGLMHVLVPDGSVNTAAAGRMMPQVRRVLARRGVPAGRIVVSRYDASGYEEAPIRLLYQGLDAHTDACGRWPKDLADQPGNESYENFGCAMQNNLAAEIDNPGDLIAPRGMSPIDSQRRTVVYDNYVQNGTGGGSSSQ